MGSDTDRDAMANVGKVPDPKHWDMLGQDGKYIVSQLMAEWERQFAAKAQDYNDNQNENHRVLGVRGQFADIWRKIGKLKKALWEGQPLVGEQPREILMDLIAHCFLTIAMMDADPGDGTPEQPAVLTTEREGGNVHLAGDRPWALTSSGNMLSPDAQESRLWPRCGRERCTVHAMVPLAELRAAGVVKIVPGEPKEGSVLPAIRATETETAVVYCHG